MGWECTGCSECWVERRKSEGGKPSRCGKCGAGGVPLLKGAPLKCERCFWRDLAPWSCCYGPVCKRSRAYTREIGGDLQADALPSQFYSLPAAWATSSQVGCHSSSSFHIRRWRRLRHQGKPMQAPSCQASSPDRPLLRGVLEKTFTPQADAQADAHADACTSMYEHALTSI